jgi:hypothetical protein
MISKKRVLLALLDPEEKGIKVPLNVENYSPDTALQPMTCTSNYVYIKVTIHKDTSQDESAGDISR